MNTIKMIGVILAVFVMVGLSSNAMAGSYTITTTAEQDAQLNTLASDAGITAQQLIDAKFSVYLEAGLRKKASMKARRIQRVLTDMSLTDAEKQAQVDAIMAE